MNKPDMLKAKLRTREEVKTKSFELIESENLKKLGLNKKYYVKTYGCQMNEHDSENIKAILEQMSYTETDDMDKADLILLNTCAIRENAHNKVFGMIGRIKNLKEKNPNLIAGICGCMAQEEVVVNEILEKYNFLDIIFGTHNIHNLPNILYTAVNKKDLEVEVLSIEGEIIENIPVKRDSKYKAWVNIMYGCDKFCTYCIVPYTRGKQRSREHQYIIEEVKELVKNGYQEVTLLGQKLNAITVHVGWPDKWNDYSDLDIANDSFYEAIQRINYYTEKKAMAKLGTKKDKSNWAEGKRTRIPFVASITADGAR